MLKFLIKNKKKIYLVLIVALVIISILYLFKTSTLENYDNISLNDLSIKWGLDKSSLLHNYSQYYDKQLKSIRNNKINFIEIGIGTMVYGADSSMNNYNYDGKKKYNTGNSLRCWNEYFKNANLILGFDIQKDCMFEENKIKTELVDSTNKQKVDEIFNNKYKNVKFDVILDDGLHEINAQIKTFQNYWPYLKKNGFYFIEDIHNPTELKKRLNNLIPNKIHIEECNLKNAQNSYIIFIKK